MASNMSATCTRCACYLSYSVTLVCRECVSHLRFRSPPSFLQVKHLGESGSGLKVIIMCYCLCYASYQEPQKALGSCCVWSCRNTQEGAPHMTSLLPSRVVSVEARWFLQTSPSSSIKCEACTVALLLMPSHSQADVSGICKAVPQSFCMWPTHVQENCVDLVNVATNGNCLAWGASDIGEFVGLTCSQRWDPHSELLALCSSICHVA